MRFHQPVGVIPQNNDYINVSINVNLISSDTDYQLTRNNENDFTSNTEGLKQPEFKSAVITKRGENANNFDSTLDKTTTLEDILKQKPDSQYFKSYFGTQKTDTTNVDLNNGNDGVIFIETLNFTEDNLLKLVASSPTTPYDNCVTNQSFNEQICLSSFQRKRRENLIKLDLESNYMTKHEGPMQVGDNSAGCSVESSPVDSLLDDQELLSPSPSSFADLSSPDPIELQQRRCYPRGIINPNYPGFQHLAHTLAEHFIDHHQQFEQSSDSEISDDFDFDVAYRAGNLGNVNIMNDINDSNNNNDNINNNGDGPDKNIDLNRNKNRRSSFSVPDHVANDLGMMKESQAVIGKEYEDGNVNLMMKSETKVFCESKQLDLHETHLEFERFSSEDEDEECCNVLSTTAPSNFKTQLDPNQMDFDDDDLADLSGEDDAAIKNELESIDTENDNDMNENINCDLATYLHQYDYKMDLKKSYNERLEHAADEECLTDEDNTKLPTPDILIEHNSKKLQNDERSAKMTTDRTKHENVNDDDGGKRQCNVDVSPSDELRDYQPDLIKSITDAITANDNNQGADEMTKTRTEKVREQSGEGDGDNGISSPVEHKIPDNEKKTNDDDDEKIINQVQTEETFENVDDEMEINLGTRAVSRNLPLSFESATSTTVDIIGDFGKEVEKEIGLIVSGYRNATNEMCSGVMSSGKKAQLSIRPVRTQNYSTTNKVELVFDENKFIEHLKYFSKMGDASLSNVEETIIVKNTLVDASDRHELCVNLDSPDAESFIPTAIVKPKYQKLSFDERQLPVCGSTDDNTWLSQANASSTTTITTTPRKVQKHLPKSQKSFAKQTRKLVNRSGEICADYDACNKEAIGLLRHSEKDIDCGVTQNSIAIVQPLKKVIEANASVNMGDEKHQNPIDCSINSNVMSHKHEQKTRNSSKIIATNEIASRMNECGNNNFNAAPRKVVNIVRDSEKKVPTKKKEHKDNSDIFDVYNIETALPVIDLEAIETHLMAAKEEEQMRKNDREAIRRRLAMGEEDDYFTDLAASRPIRKPNLQSRLQNGKNLQICFMNEAASDSESSDSETCPKLSQGMSRKKNVQRSSSLMNHRNASLSNNPYNSRPLSVVKSVMDPVEKAERPATLALGPPSDNNFFTQQARLQIEARMALAQAKDMAHMQMEIERQKQGMCPITELVHQTLDKVGMRIPATKRRLSRQLLTNMNIAQLQIIINEFHTFIETLNEVLVKYLMDRDDLSMRQDSMLIDIEDITRYLAEKEEVQLNNGHPIVTISQPPQKHQTEPKPAFTTKRITTITPAAPAPMVATVRQQPAITRQMPKAFQLQHMNKKSLVVNGNGNTVRTSISRDSIEQNGLHL